MYALRRQPDADTFQIDTNDATIEAENVVIATGPYQRPAVPGAAKGLTGTFQISASTYRNPDQLPAGGVLVVGAGASGCQIAQELLEAGRPVFLSVGPHRRVPRRYRGRDIIWWITQLGLDEKVADENTVRQPPLLISGANGGHTIDLRAFAASGMVLLGRLTGAQNRVASFASDLAADLAAGDASYTAFIQAADAHAALTGMAFPRSPDAATYAPVPEPAATVDLHAAGINTVIWATGYRYDFGWVDLDVFAANGDPVQRRGVTAVPGAYFLGLSLLHKTKSSFLSGVGEDAIYLAEQIMMRNKVIQQGSSIHCFQ